MPTPSTSSSTSDPTLSTSSSTGDPMPSTSSSTGDPMPSMPSNITRSNDTYVYGIGMLAVLAIGVCVFFTYSQAKNKKQDNDRLMAQPEQKKGSTTKKTSHALVKNIQ